MDQFSNQDINSLLADSPTAQKQKSDNNISKGNALSRLLSSKP